MLHVLDLFSGIGGFSLGLERTGGFQTAAFCEVDEAAQKVLRKRWPATPIFKDVSKLTKRSLDETVAIPIHVITGGFPCQDISFAGRGAGLSGARSGLWYEFHRLIQEIQPRYAIIENVSALRSRGLDTVLRGLSEIGYDAEWHCIPASAVGAPHQRDRIWIVAYAGHDRGEIGYAERPAQDRQRSADNAVPRSATMADRIRSRLEGYARNGEDFRLPQQDGPVASQGVCRGGHPGWWWQIEPSVDRVAHGVPNRVDRLKQLGNAVVPQIPEVIGYAILDRELDKASGIR